MDLFANIYIGFPEGEGGGVLNYFCISQHTIVLVVSHVIFNIRIKICIIRKYPLSHSASETKHCVKQNNSCLVFFTEGWACNCTGTVNRNY